METKKVLLELQLPVDKLKALTPVIRDGKITLTLGKNSFVACNASFIACNSAFSENKAAFVACNAKFSK